MCTEQCTAENHCTALQTERNTAVYITVHTVHSAQATVTVQCTVHSTVQSGGERGPRVPRVAGGPFAEGDPGTRGDKGL